VATLKGHDGPIQAVAFSPDGTRVASADQGGNIRFWDVSTGHQRLALVGRQGRVDCLTFSPGGETLASAGWDGTIVLWDAPSGVPRSVLRGHSAPVSSLVFTRDALFSGSYDGNVLRWEPKPPQASAGGEG
jgi:WD40 repeat protein